MEAQDDGEANDEARAPQPNTNRVPPTPIVEDYATDEEGEAGADEDITSSEVPTDPPTIMQGPMTQARKRQLNLEVSSFLSDIFHTFENRLLPNDVILLRNIGEGQEGLRGRGGGDDDQQGRPT